MIEVNKEIIMNYLMQKSLELSQRPVVTETTRRVMEIRNNLAGKVDRTVKKVAGTLGLVVRDDITRTNHHVRGVKHNVAELTKTVKNLQDQLRESEGKIQEYDAKLKESENRTAEYQARLKDSGAKIREYESRLQEFEAKIRDLEKKAAGPPYPINAPVREA